MLLERAKIIIKEKLKTHFESGRSNTNDRDVIKERLTELKRVKEEKINEARRLTAQKELLQNKIKNLKTIGIETVKTRQGTNLKPRNFKFLRGQLDSQSRDHNEIDNLESQPRNSGWSDLYRKGNVVEEINSDLENSCHM